MASLAHDTFADVFLHRDDTKAVETTDGGYMAWGRGGWNNSIGQTVLNEIANLFFANFARHVYGHMTQSWSGYWR